MEVPPSQDSPKKMLNDHCIIHMLCQLTNVADFLSAAETCTQFQACAQYCFRYMNFHHFQSIPIHYKQDERLPTDRVESFMNIFGHLIPSIKVGCSGRDDEIFQMISNYCGESLKELKCSYFRPEMSDPNQFPALEKLSFTGYLPNTFELNSPLRSLTFDRVNFLTQKSWFMRNYLKLEHIKLSDILDLTDAILNEFVKLNPQLKCLDLDNCEQLTSGIVGMISESLPNLEHLCLLSLSGFEINSFLEREEDVFGSLLKLRNLKSLVCGNSSGFSVEKLINAFVEFNVPMESLVFFPYDEDMASSLNNQLSTLKTLKHLTLPYHLPVERLVRLLETQTELESIRFVSGVRDYMGNANVSLNFYDYIFIALAYGVKITQMSCRTFGAKVDLLTYQTILEYCKGCRVSVRIEVLCYEDHITVPEDILQANRKWLDVITVGPFKTHI